jgi:hypothetical protein
MTLHENMWHVRESHGMLVLVRPNDSSSFSILAHDTVGEDWIWWFAEHMNGDTMRPWPQDGLRMYDTSERGALFVYDGFPVGFISFHEYEWIWMPVGPDGEDLGVGHVTTQYIQVDPDAHDRFVAERVRIASMPEAARLASEAEFAGRVNYHRDETRDLALLYGRMKSLASGRYRRQRRSCA